MAEKEAHLTQTHQIKPSIFDFAAQESLDSLLYPAIKRVADVLSLRHENFNFISKWFNELFYISHFFLQLHYLRKFGGTFSETFYGLKRISVKNGTTNLSNKDIMMSLLFCSVVPYLRTKLSDIADRAYFDILPFERERNKTLLLKAIIGLNKHTNISLQLITFAQYLRYLSGKSEYVSPFLWASKLKLEYLRDEEFSADGLSFRNFLPQILRRSLEVTAFFIQFCQWWQTERIGSLTKLPIPPAPQINEAGYQFADICPICGEKRKAETVLSVSGFVFCFACIYDYITKHGSCPITDLPASVTNLIMLYPPN